jgi:nucleoside-diphosphate kinase
MANLKEEKTVVIVKPDGVKRGLTGEIVRRIEQRGLKVIALKMFWATHEQMDAHYPKDREWITGLGKNTARAYEEYKLEQTLQADFGTEDLYEIGKNVRAWLVEYMTSAPLVKMVVSGLHAIPMVRKIVGNTLPSFAEMGTIRGDFSIDSPALANAEKRAVHNLVHASGNAEEAANEIQLWFSPEELHDYTRAEEDIMF